MQKCKIVVLTPAYNDLDQISEYYLTRVGDCSAEAITDKILSCIENLADHPYLGAEHADVFLKNRGYRSLVCGEYICIYKVVGEDIFICRIVHGSISYPSTFYTF